MIFGNIVTTNRFQLAPRSVNEMGISSRLGSGTSNNRDCHMRREVTLHPSRASAQSTPLPRDPVSLLSFHETGSIDGAVFRRGRWTNASHVASRVTSMFPGRPRSPHTATAHNVSVAAFRSPRSKPTGNCLFFLDFLLARFRSSLRFAFAALSASRLSRSSISMTLRGGAFVFS